MMKNILLIFIVSTALFFAGCKKDNATNQPPVITNLIMIPTSPISSTVVTITVTATDAKGISTVKLYYSVGSGNYTVVNMTPNGDNYSAVIPAQATGSVVSYYVEALNLSGLVAFAPETGSVAPATYTVAPTANYIFMNEVWSWGLTPDFDWIELYNTSNSDVNIGGYKLYDSGGQANPSLKLRIPDGTIITAQGFFTIVVDDPAISGNFGLSKSGEEIWLENSGGDIIDNFVYAATTLATQSYGRKPDGSTNFYIFNEITKNTTNNNATTFK